MTMSGFLPRRWRTGTDAARHAEAIAGILETPPIAPAQGGPVLISLIGTAAVLPYLVAVKSFHRHLGRGSIAIVDDGTLTGEDRTILAHHCNDPEIIPLKAVKRGPFPAGGEWELLLTILDRRRGHYWIRLDPHTVTLGPVPEIEAAIAGNRSFTLLAGEEKTDGVAMRIERHFASLPADRGWCSLGSCAGVTGFAAGGTGRPLAAAFLAELKALASEDDALLSKAAAVGGNLLFAHEPQPVLLPQERYCACRATPSDRKAALVHFPAGCRHQGDAYASASRAVIAELAGSDR